MKRKLIVVLLMLSAVFTISAIEIKPPSPKKYHTEKELELLRQSSSIPIGPGNYFQHSESCHGCHGYDWTYQTNIDESGRDVNLYDRWAGSMMANSAVDPFWRAKVSHETLINPTHSVALQNKCTSCHAPMGHYTAFLQGTGPYLISNLIGDSLGLDGVSCAGCHTIGPNAGAAFSGNIAYDTSRNIYGPYTNPFIGPMQLYEGYTPMFGQHMDESRVCASCHTLITDAVDLSGNPTGTQFIEQATYLEYQNSSFPAANIKCQTCHMPQILDPIVIANGFTNLTARTPFNQHYFAGGNTFMINLIKQNKTSLGITKSDAHFDTAFAAASRMLREQTATMDIVNNNISNDTLYLSVGVLNSAGHKLPSGYPSRRMILQVVVTDMNNDTLFRSGIVDNNYRVIGESPLFNPHYQIINQSDITQIYEMVMGDVTSSPTTVLERAFTTLKDNRIPPNGFTSTTAVYDSVAISPDAFADPDFNKVNGIEGSGKDYTHFHIPVAGISGPVNIYARLLYQSVPPKFTDEMFLINSAPIDTFRNMYQIADNTPFEITSDSILNFPVSIGPEHTPIPIITISGVSGEGKFNVFCDKENIRTIEIYNLEGQLVVKKSDINDKNAVMQIRGPKGIYLIRVTGATVRYNAKVVYH